ncbi:MAG: hypothetical protein ACC645_20495 [Pirellulales bacterium]
MTDVHSIRLRKPWHRWVIDRKEESAAASADGAAVGPAEGGEPDGSGPDGNGPVRTLQAVRYVRKFHRPMGVEPHETVYLAIEPSVQLAALWFNGEELTRRDDHDTWHRFDVTERLKEWNEIGLDTACPVSGASVEVVRSVDPPCNVRLEIHGVGGRRPPAPRS